METTKVQVSIKDRATWVPLERYNPSLLPREDVRVTALMAYLEQQSKNQERPDWKAWMRALPDSLRSPQKSEPTDCFVKLSVNSYIRCATATILHPVYIAVLAPPSKCLALVVEQDAKQTPQENERRVRHDGRDETIRNDPVSDKLAEAVAPHILVDSYCNEKTASHLKLSAR